MPAHVELLKTPVGLPLSANAHRDPDRPEPDGDDPDWDLVLPDEDEPYPEPGDFWIDDDDWEDAA